VNLSLLLGAILSWGVMWPLISDLEGDWYPSNIPESSMSSLQGYKVCFSVYVGYCTCQLYFLFYLSCLIVQAFICIALILGDGLYNFAKIIALTVKNLIEKSKLKNTKKGRNSDKYMQVQSL
jgi:hypothetical protein